MTKQHDTEISRQNTGWIFLYSLGGLLLDGLQPIDPFCLLVILIWLVKPFLMQHRWRIVHELAGIPMRIVRRIEKKLPVRRKHMRKKTIVQNFMTVSVAVSMLAVSGASAIVKAAPSQAEMFAFAPEEDGLVIATRIRDFFGKQVISSP